MPLNARIIITLKNGVLDPQGVASKSALEHMGFSDIGAIRQGKVIDIAFDHDDKSRAESDAKDMCEKLLANTVIESYDITWP